MKALTGKDFSFAHICLVMNTKEMSVINADHLKRHINNNVREETHLRDQLLITVTFTQA